MEQCDRHDEELYGGWGKVGLVARVARGEEKMEDIRDDFREVKRSMRWALSLLVAVLGLLIGVLVRH
jgi:hypothetical protein